MKKVKRAESNKSKDLKNVANKSKHNKNKAKKEKQTQKIVQKDQNVVAAAKKEKKQKKKSKTHPPNNGTQIKLEPEEPKDKKKSHEIAKTHPLNNGIQIKLEPKELDEKALAKIEKKKAKKLAKKLKKKQQKEEQKSSPENLPKPIEQQNGQKKDKKKKKIIKTEQKEEKKSSPDGLPKPSTQQNGQKKDKKKKPVQKNEEGKEYPAKDPNLAASTIFVGNLPTTVKRVQIAKLFAKFGGVRGIRLRTAAGQVLFKHKQRKLAGSLNAYVILNDAESAQKALELNGTEFKSSHLRVTPADAKKTQSGHDSKRTIFVGNLKYTANEKKLHEIFSNCGEINYIRCLGNGKNGCKGVAYVCFKSPEAVGLALELNETLLDERPIHVERYSKKKLGAKEARDSQESGKQKPKPGGAKKRIDAKQQKEGKHGKADSSLGKKKKSDFHGVKATGINKKKNNNKKQNSEMKGLAKKIAPIIKKEEKA